MKNLFKYLVITIVLITSKLCYAATTNCEADAEKYRVVFGNGVLTTIEGASASRNELQLALGSQLNDQKIAFDIAYNYKVDWYADFIQSYNQLGNQFDHNFLITLSNAGLMPDWMKTMFQNKILENYIINAPELPAHVEKYKESILRGEKVLVASHSQGNFYVNEAKQLLEASQPSVPMQSFGIFGVATPASTVGGNLEPYITNNKDFINIILNNLPENLTLSLINANQGNENPQIDPIDAHGFTETYLNPKYNARSKLIQGVKSKLTSLIDPPEVIGSGPINATLSWSVANTDVDLHITEPDGSHIYYANPQGISGYLDIDNLTGSGPEHYYTDCNQLAVGTYTLGVQYFSDHEKQVGDEIKPARPVVANVTVTIPGSTKFYTILLNSDNQPVKPFAKIIVERIVNPTNPNINGKLKYTIQDLNLQ